MYFEFVSMSHSEERLRRKNRRRGETLTKYKRREREDGENGENGKGKRFKSGRKPSIFPQINFL